MLSGSASHDRPPLIGRSWMSPPMVPITTPKRSVFVSLATAPSRGSVCWLFAMPKTVCTDCVRNQMRSVALSQLPDGLYHAS